MNGILGSVEHAQNLAMEEKEPTQERRNEKNLVEGHVMVDHLSQKVAIPIAVVVSCQL